MLKEIKFRGLKRDGSGWVYGDLIHDEYGDCSIYEIAGVVHDVKNETVGQFIGMKDSSKKEIYEGDMVILGDDECELERVVSDFGEVDVDDLGMDFSVTLLKWHIQYSMCGVEVIGNIHQQEPTK